MKLSDYYAQLPREPKPTLAGWGGKFGVGASVFRDWMLGNKSPRENNLKLIYLETKGIVTPNDFYPIDEWQKELDNRN